MDPCERLDETGSVGDFTQGFALVGSRGEAASLGSADLDFLLRASREDDSGGGEQKCSSKMRPRSGHGNTGERRRAA
jgi:hypothetical protein